MIDFDPSELAQWADKPDCSSQLPDLIRRLILATIPRASLVDMPSGSSVTQGGWDGLLEVAESNPWVPAGTSAWEMSCQSGITAKANADYIKRTANPGRVDPNRATFHFVTPRKWGSKAKWIKAHQGEKKWANVRALDASDLVQWLQQAQAVADWLARRMGKIPASGAVSLDDWWQGWSWLTNPRTSPELVMAGRLEQADQLATCLKESPAQFYVQGETQDEAIAFFAASALTAWDDWGAHAVSRTLVVESQEAWRSLEHHTTPLVLIRRFAGQVASSVAVGAGHHVLIPISQADDQRGNGFKLPRLAREETVTALVNMGLAEEKARSLTRTTARHMRVLRRQLQEDAGGPVPEWTSSLAGHLLATAALAGQWDDNNHGDRDIVTQITGRPYEEVAFELALQAQQPDAPVVKVGNRWRFISHEEAWYLLATLLTNDDLHRFRGVASEVLGTISPKFDLPVDERYMAAVKGKNLPHSETVRSGIARALALMGSHPERAKHASQATDLPFVVIRDVLEQSYGWQIWATFDRDLSTLAEAAPQALLDQIGRNLEGKANTFKELFEQEGDGVFGGAPHTGLLWALETLAWSKDYFSQAVLHLARLAELDPGGRFSNRPAASLESLFHYSIRFSEVSDDQRHDTIDMLFRSVPNQAWRLIVNIWPTGHDTILLRTPPTWRAWGQDADRTPTVAEARKFLDGIIERVLQHVGTDARRWTDLIDILPNIPEASAKEAADRLPALVDQLREQPGAEELWAKIRSTLHHHRSFPDAGWAMPAKGLDSLESIYQRLTPDDPVAANAWLFGSWPGLPEGQETSADYSEHIFKAQQAAVRAVFEKNGAACIAGIARAAEVPSRVGWAVALGLDNDAAALHLALPHLGSADGKLREFARGVCAGLFSRSGWPALEQAFKDIKLARPTPEALADIYLAAPSERETWRRLDEEDEQARRSYWSIFNWFSNRVEGQADLSFATERLLEVHRSPVAVELLWYRGNTPAPEVIIRVLEQLPGDVVSQVASGASPQPQIQGYHLARLFEKLDQSPDVSEETIAKLEIPYVGVLEHDRPNLALHRQVTKDPATFADLITWGFKRSDSQSDHQAGNEDERINRARIAVDILFQLRQLPGLREDGTVDSAVLDAWVEAVRRLCRERGREDIGDDRIGCVLANAPGDSDGVWPCEAVRDVLDRCRSRPMGKGFAVGKHNLRGVTSRGVFDGGGQERSLAEKLRQDAAQITSKWPFTAEWLRRIAESYEREARGNDEEADWRDQFEA